MTTEYEIVFKKLETLRQTEPQSFLSEQEYNEAEEIQRLRQIIAEVVEWSDCNYYTST